jgi:hypothetical protein
MTKKSLAARKTEPKVVPLYRCLQSEFYSVAFIGWDNYDNNQAEFQSYNTNFTPAFGQQNVTALINAKNMPDEKQREEDKYNLHVKLVELSPITISHWDKLEGNILLTFPESEQKAVLEAAGKTYYKKANNNNWTALSMMMDAGKACYTKHSTKFAAAGVPLSAATDFNTARTTYTTLLNNYTNAVEAVHVARNNKIKANNAVYKALMSMFKIGKILFKKDEAKFKLFTFSQILATFTGPGNHYRTFELAPSASMNLDIIIMHSDVINLLETDIIICEQNSENACAVGTGQLIKGKTTDVLILSKRNICITNTSSTLPAKFSIRCEKLS